MVESPRLLETLTEDPNKKILIEQLTQEERKTINGTNPEDLNSFKDLDQRDVAKRLIDAGEGDAVARYLGDFVGLDQRDVANKLFDAGEGYTVAKYLGNFVGLDHNVIANRLIDEDMGYAVARFLGNFVGLEHNVIADRLIDVDMGYTVAEYLGNFVGLDHNVIANKLIDEGKGHTVAEYLGNFVGLDHNVIANRLFDAKIGYTVARYLGNFVGLDHNVIANKLFDARMGYAVAEYLGNFVGLDQRDVANKLFDAGMGYTVAEYLANFVDLDQRDVANRLIDEGMGDAVADYLGNFVGLDHNEIANRLIDMGYGKAVARYLRNFVGLDHTEIARKLLKSNAGLDRSVFNTIFDFSEALRNSGIPIEFFVLEDEKLQELKDKGMTPELMLKFINRYGKAVNYVPDLFWEAGIADFTEVTSKKLRKKMDTIALNSILSNEKHQNDWPALKSGIEIFGKDKMANFILERPEVSLHTKLMYFQSLVEMYKVSKKNPKQFFGDIMFKVVQDNSMYESGTSFDELNRVCSLLDLSIFTNEDTQNEVQAYIERYRSVFDSPEYLQYLADDITAIFGSWSDLKRGASILAELKSAELLEAIRNIEDPRMQEWLKVVLFHESSKVDVQAVIQMIRNPDRFLERGDAHAPSGIHHKKNPSNYTGLVSPREIVEGLIGGKIDNIQTFKPYKKTLILPTGDLSDDQWLETFLSPKTEEDTVRKKIKGNEKLEEEIKALLLRFNVEKDSSEDINSLKTHLGTKIYKEFLQEFYQLLQNEEFGFPESVFRENFIEISAEVHPKSDPIAVVAGDDTATCMPFGSGKNNIYMINPTMGMFTLRVKTGGNTYRTVAQSVLTLNRQITGHTAMEIIQMLTQGDTDQAWERPNGKPFVVACDNIEIAPNFKRLEELIINSYRQFFEEYLGNSDTTVPGMPIDPSRVIVGLNYSDVRGLPTIQNTYLPVVPPSYSDNVGPVTGNIALGDPPTRENELPGFDPGVQVLDLTDMLDVVAIEHFVYKETDMGEDPTSIMNNAISCAFYSEFRNRPNMSLVYRDNQGVAQGFLIAYETPGAGNNTPEIYVHDLAAMPDSALAGGRLIMEFVKNYQEQYLEKGLLFPITMDARYETSLPIILKHFERLGKKSGIKIELKNRGGHYQGRQSISLVPRMINNPSA